MASHLKASAAAAPSCAASPLDLARGENGHFERRCKLNGYRMGRYKDYREPKRRGYDDDSAPEDRLSRRQNPRPGAPQTSESVDAIVKWFNAEKGFGFVTVAGGPDAFIHARALEAAGHSSVPEGARVKVRISQGQKGPQVTEVIDVDASAAQVTSRNERRSSLRPSSQRRFDMGPTEECLGSVKWYNAEKGFGFIAPDRGGKDVFVHVTTLDRGGLTDLAEGQRVRMQISLGQKGPEAQSIELLD
jgi:CspA family cold shock protein